MRRGRRCSQSQSLLKKHPRTNPTVALLEFLVGPRRRSHRARERKSSRVSFPRSPFPRRLPTPIPRDPDPFFGETQI